MLGMQCGLRFQLNGKPQFLTNGGWELAHLRTSCSASKRCVIKIMRWKRTQLLKILPWLFMQQAYSTMLDPSVCVLFWLLLQIYTLIGVVIEAGGFTTSPISLVQNRERWIEYKTPRAEVELGTCIIPPSTPTRCPLSCLPLCFLSRSFYTISPPHSSFDCSFL